MKSSAKERQLIFIKIEYLSQIEDFEPNCRQTHVDDETKKGIIESSRKPLGLLIIFAASQQWCKGFERARCTNLKCTKSRERKEKR